MKIAVIGALEHEIQSLVALYGAEKLEAKGDTAVYHAATEKNDLYISLCGIGKVNAAMAAQHLADKYSPDVIVNIGVAGAVAPEVHTFDVVIGDRVVYHDFYPLSMLAQSYPHLEEFHTDERLRKLAEKICRDLPDAECHVGTVVTGDCFVDDPAKSAYLGRTFGALCCEMEGAAVAQVCAANRIPFLVIRCMSDHADDNALTSFETLVERASASACRILSGLADAL